MIKWDGSGKRRNQIRIILVELIGGPFCGIRFWIHAHADQMHIEDPLDSKRVSIYRATKKTPREDPRAPENVPVHEFEYIRSEKR